MNEITSRASREQVAAIISEHLKRKGLDAVLVGGSVVSIYTNNLFPSDDLDFAT